MKTGSSGDYSDIIHLPHPDLKRHPRMARHARAAQFAPFAALSGYSEAVMETERMTEQQACLAEDRTEEIDMKLQGIAGMLACGQHPFITIDYFVPDEKKAGGAYLKKTGHVIKIDTVMQTILFHDQTKIPFGNIIDIR